MWSYLHYCVIIMTSLNFVFVFGVLAVNFTYTRAISRDDRNKINEAIMPFVNQCREEFKLSNVEVQAAKEAGTPINLENCFMGCVFKRAEVINDKGLFDTDKAAAMIKKYLQDESVQNKALEIIHTCKTVNDRDVTDGDKGCDRAGFLFQCLIPQNKVFIN